MSEDTKKLDSLSWNLLGWILDIIAIGALGFSIHLHTRISDLEIWKAETNGNRFTNNDAYALTSKDAVEKQAIWRAMNDMQGQWLKEIGQVNIALAEIKADLKHGEKERLLK